MKRVTAAIISKNGKFLIGRRAQNQPLAGAWEFPGGKIEAGESPEECLKRELQEEFGIDSEIGEFFNSSRHVYEGGEISLEAYWVDSWTGDFTPIVHDEIAWVPGSALCEYELLPADIPIAERIKEGPGYSVESLYNRRADIHRWFSGQMQGGISAPPQAPYVFLFTGESGESFGYRDEWIDGVFHYVGEGQVGDMEFVRGNRAIRDHSQNGKEILLFGALGKSKPVQFHGQFECASWEEASGPDKNGDKRRLIIFHLIPTASSVLVDSAKPMPAEPIEQLKAQAYEAASEPQKVSSSEVKKEHFRRSEIVKRYVLARAQGVCELCRRLAPFVKRDGTPYLEPHHTKRLADSGPDHPRWVAAICPNCHREIHSGKDGSEKNRALQEFIGTLEE